MHETHGDRLEGETLSSTTSSGAVRQLPTSHGVGKFSAVILEKIPEIRRLTPEEKLMLLTELWDELTANPDEATLTPEQEDLLDRRWQDYRKDPSQSSSWQVVKDRVRRGRP